jgi:hypothetical protein
LVDIEITLALVPKKDMYAPLPSVGADKESVVPPILVPVVALNVPNVPSTAHCHPVYPLYEVARSTSPYSIVNPEGRVPSFEYPITFDIVVDFVNPHRT